MIECYYKWCEFHNLDEPFCTKAKCEVSEKQMKRYQYFRKLENMIDLIIKTKKGDSYELTLEEAKELYEQLDDMFVPKSSSQRNTSKSVSKKSLSDDPWQQHWEDNGLLLRGY